MSNSRQQNDTVPNINLWLEDDYFSDSYTQTPVKSPSLSRPHSNSLTPSVSSSVLSMFPKPQKVNCQLENTFAELAQFIKVELLDKLGRVCPPASPMKANRSTLSVSRELLVNSALQAKSEILTQKDNAIISENNQACGRNFDTMMKVSASFDRQVMCAVNLQEKLKLIGFDIPEKTLSFAVKNFEPIRFIMMLYFMHKYPLYSVEAIYNAMQANYKMDIYVAFKAYDDYLYKHTLTSTAAESYGFGKTVPH